MRRRDAREKAFQFLFQIDAHEEVTDQMKEDYLEEQGNDDFLKQLIEGVLANWETMDDLIALHLTNWSIERLPVVERTVLRLATYEINHLPDVPENVSINEAVELGNRFGDEKSGKFINGVLSNIINKRGIE